ncbi:MAG: aromatic amino acid transport family protein [Patescibacteria group bacterium]
MSKNYLYAISILAGTVIGGGIFAIPYTVSKAGVLGVVIFFPLLIFVQYLLHKIYAEVVLSTKQMHRLPGYVGVYCSKRIRNIVLAISIIGKHGTLLIYIIIGGIFLYGIFNPFFGGGIFLYTSILFLLESFIVLVGLRMIANAEFLFTSMIIAVIMIILYKSWGSLEVSNYHFVDSVNIFLPYGPIFLAVGGQAAIPEVCRLLKKEKKKIKSAIAWGTILPGVITAIFALIVVGITGANTTSESLVGLRMYFSNGVITSTLFLGLLTVTTSFIIISQSLREVYWWDVGMNKTWAWALACGVPFLLYLAGFRNLTDVVGVTGSIVGGVFGIILIVLLFTVRKKRRITPVLQNKINKPAAYILSLMFILGLVYEIWAFMN